ncbi:MAG: hypothetical protein HYX76_11720 [Acidobacteria bacterium]|nr:hypothetical protein [Acidobacteriota bacterium]
MIRRSFASIAALVLAAALGTTVPDSAVVARADQTVPERMYAALRWRLVGPFRGGRVLAVSGVVNQPNVFYFGSVAGGVWKTTNAGQTWEPIFDGQPIASIGALAVAPSDPNAIYVGTGEADMRSDISFGRGVYKSADAGRTWQRLGLEDTHHIGRIAVDPRNREIVLVAALGHAYGANPERGVFRSADGGRTWQKVLYKNENVGAIDLSLVPDNPDIVYAALWNTRRAPWERYPPVNGPGSGLYRSTDGGISWSEIAGRGLPTRNIGRIGVAAAAGGKRVYALVDADSAGLYRSDDGGVSWRLVGTDPRIRSRAWYFGGITIDPRNPDQVYIGNVALYRSTDAGRTFEAIKGAPGGDDYHSLWIDPNDPSRVIAGTDQGTIISVDGGRTWSSWYNQPTAQFYHVATDTRFPYVIYGAQQDSGTVGIASRGDYGAITPRDWYTVGGGESGYIVPDPVDPDVVYGGSVLGALYRFTKRSGQSQDISPWPTPNFDLPRAEQRYRFTWTSPLAFSPSDPRVMYFGSQIMFRSADAGMSWTIMSPDLSRQTNRVPASGGSMIQDLAATEAYGVIYTIVPSAAAKGLIWAGTDDGRIHLTRDEGASWQDVTPQHLDAWSMVSMVDASRHDPAAAYAAIDRHRLDDYRPHMLRTRDYGATWAEIVNGIDPFAYVHVVREDPARKGLLFAGTELGVYVSFTDGDRWQRLQLNLPVAPVHDLVIHDNDIVVATHGRSFWVLDDISPLRQVDGAVIQADAHLFQPATAIRVRRSVNTDTPLPPETPLGANPPNGAIIYYSLGSEPPGEVSLEILDAAGRLVRRFSSHDPPPPPPSPPPAAGYWFRPAAPLPKAAGLNRFVWDLRHPRPHAIRSSYTIAAVYGEDTPALPLGPQVVPGPYQVRLTVAGRSFTAPLTVKMDPRVTTPANDLTRQFELEMKIAEALASTHETLDEVRAFRARLVELRKRIPAGKRGESVLAALTSLEDKTAALEGVSQPTSQVGDLQASNAAFASLMVVVDSADTAPTKPSVELFDEYRRRFDAQLAAWDALRTTEMAALERMFERPGRRRKR